MMRELPAIVVLIVVSAVLSISNGCYDGTTGTGNLPRSFPHSPKGYELYSWQGEGGRWRYTLITGTNRLKTAEELIAEGDAVGDEGWVKVTVIGEDALRDLLGRLPAGEHIFWRGAAALPEGAETGQFRLPEESIVTAVKERCRELNLELIVEAGDGRNGANQGEGIAQPELEAALQLPQTVTAGEPVELSFTLINHEPHSLYVLEWYTPLEGIAGEIFWVERDGKPLPYQGILAMRGDPEAENYRLLPPGGSVTATVDLAQAYDFTEAGDYTVAFLSPRISHVARTEAEMAQTVDELGLVPIRSNTATVMVEAGEW